MSLFKVLKTAAQAVPGLGTAVQIYDAATGQNPTINAISDKLNVEEIKSSQEIDQESVGAESSQAIEEGLMQAAGTLQPTIQQSQELQNQLQSILMGQTPVSDLAGYDSMVRARGEAIDDLATMRAGTGKFFSGTTAEQAADIGGAMENELIQQNIRNLMMGAQPGQSFTSQLASAQMGAGGQQAGIPLSLANMQMQLQQMQMQQQMAQQANEQAFWGDVMGGLGSIGGLMLMTSDVRLKENIQKLGKRNGYNWYSWNYKGDDKRYEGVMAHEVAQTNPDAVIEKDGYLVVDYARL